MKIFTTKTRLARAAMTLLVALLTTATAWAQSLSGSGTSTDPYVINNADDWATFASDVNDGYSYESKIVKLTDNIGTTTAPVTTMVGTVNNDDSKGYPFKGTFEGNGKTLTIGLTTDNYDYNFYAPFRCVDGATTIRNLHIAGTINAGQKKFAAGLVGNSFGNVTISNCWSSVAITSDRSSLTDKDASHGGFVGVVKGGSVTISNSLFDGSITDAAATNCGGFMGWHDGAYRVSFTITNIST